MIKAVALDFDGVILESLDLKMRAFRTLFQDYPEHLDRIVKLHEENGGLSRYEKFAIIYRDFLRKPFSEAEERRLDRAFSSLVVKEIVACPFVPGALEFLVRESGHVPFFVVSGTPEAELREIVQLRKLDRYFCRVYGSPRSKDVLLREILAVNSLKSSEVLFVGDSMTDFMASASVGAHFVGRVSAGLANPFPNSVRWVVSDLNELASRWPAIQAELS